MLKFVDFELTNFLLPCLRKKPVFRSFSFSAQIFLLASSETKVFMWSETVSVYELSTMAAGHFPTGTTVVAGTRVGSVVPHVPCVVT